MGKRRKIHFYYDQEKALQQKLEPIFSLVEHRNFSIVENPNEADFIISIGGDGAFLQAVRKTGFRQNCLYAGVTHGDESGLYCDFELDKFEELLHILETEDIQFRRFPIIKVQVNGQSSFYCLNEVSLRSTIIKTIVIDVFIDDKHFETFRGDGLIVATPTGSTGYNKSTQGAVIDPLIPSYQVTEIASLNNNKYRTLGSSFVLSKERKLTLEVVQDGNNYPIIGLDNEAYSIRNIKNLNITLSDKRIRTIKLKNNSYWDRVKRTFL